MSSVPQYVKDVYYFLGSLEAWESLGYCNPEASILQVLELNEGYKRDLLSNKPSVLEQLGVDFMLNILKTDKMIELSKDDEFKVILPKEHKELLISELEARIK